MAFLKVTLLILLLPGCQTRNISLISECDNMAGGMRYDTPDQSNKLIRPNTNPGRSVVIRPDPASATTPFSLATFPAPVGSPVGRATLLEIGGDDENAEVVSVTLVNTNPFNAANRDFAVPASIVARPQALVEWGVAGVQAQALVDFEHGVSFSVPCSFLRVTGINTVIPPTITGNLALGRNVQLGAFCAYGTVSRGSSFNGKLTLYQDTPPGFGGAVFKIPDYATNVLFVRAPDTTTVPIGFFDEGGDFIFLETEPIGNVNSTPVELPNDAAFVIIPPGFGVVTARLIFGLAM